MRAFDHWVASEVASLGGDYVQAARYLRGLRNRCNIRLSCAEPTGKHRGPKPLLSRHNRHSGFSTGKQGLGVFCVSGHWFGLRRGPVIHRTRGKRLTGFWRDAVAPLGTVQTIVKGLQDKRVLIDLSFAPMPWLRKAEKL